MLKKMQYIRNTKQIFLICFFLFALSPCVVKDFLLNSVYLEYAKPLNKTKSISQSNNCQYTYSDKQKKSSFNIKKVNDETVFYYLLEKPNLILKNPILSDVYSKEHSGNSPPMYILYKRLKLNMV